MSEVAERVPEEAGRPYAGPAQDFGRGANKFVLAFPD
jgi:hypothetical protein